MKFKLGILHIEILYIAYKILNQDAQIQVPVSGTNRINRTELYTSRSHGRLDSTNAGSIFGQVSGGHGRYHTEPMRMVPPVEWTILGMIQCGSLLGTYAHDTRHVPAWNLI